MNHSLNCSPVRVTSVNSYHVCVDFVCTEHDGTEHDADITAGCDSQEHVSPVFDRNPHQLPVCQRSGISCVIGKLTHAYQNEITLQFVMECTP